MPVTGAGSVTTPCKGASWPLARHAGAARVAAQQEKGDDGRRHASRRQREQPHAQRLADGDAAQPGAAVIADDFGAKQHGGNA